MISPEILPFWGLLCARRLSQRCPCPVYLQYLPENTENETKIYQGQVAKIDSKPVMKFGIKNEQWNCSTAPQYILSHITLIIQITPYSLD